MTLLKFPPLYTASLTACCFALNACSGSGSTSLPSTYAANTSSDRSVAESVMSAATTRSVLAPVTFTNVSVSAADAFVDSVGVDTHFNYGQSSYRSSYSAIRNALVNSGIRHIRDGSLGYSNPQALASLGQAGVKHSVEFPVTATAAQITATLQGFAPYVDFVEPQNEYDEKNGGDPNWVANIVSEQKLLYTTVKSNPAFSSITVLGPALGHPWNAAVIGPLDAYEDAGNEHDYTCNANPGTTTSTGIGPITTLLRNSTQSKPFWTTEVGYADNAAGWSCATSDSIIAKFDPRTIAERWLSGEQRSYFYQFADTAPGKNYDSMGLVTHSGEPKPQYRSIQSLLALLADPGSTFSPTPLTIGLGGNTSNVQQIVLAKHDGSYYVLTWLEVPALSLTGASLQVSPQTVSLVFPKTPSSLVQYTYAANGSLQPHAVTAATTESLQVTDSLTVTQVRF